MTFIRQPQIRYTNGNFAIALENPEVRIGDGAGNNTPGLDTLPDVTAQYAMSGKSVSWYVSGVLANYEVNGGPANGQSATNFGAQGGISFGIGGGSSLFGNAVVNGGRYTYYSFAQPQAVVNGTWRPSTAPACPSASTWIGAARTTPRRPSSTA